MDIYADCRKYIPDKSHRKKKQILKRYTVQSETAFEDDKNYEFLSVLVNSSNSLCSRLVERLDDQRKKTCLIKIRYAYKRTISLWKYNDYSHHHQSHFALVLKCRCDTRLFF